MRPVRRGAAPQAADFANYRDAFPNLLARLGSYCSYCERLIVTQLAVEHIQPKGLAQYAQLVGRWDNFLLACINCNSTKRDKEVRLANVLLPDRDNTFAAFEYPQDGTVVPSLRTSTQVRTLATNTLSLVGLDKRASQVQDENGKLVAVDRVAQRMEAWGIARDAKDDVDGNPGIDAVRRLSVDLAVKTGFFSIWMTVFQGDVDMRRRLIAAFAGTLGSGCFDPHTTQAVAPCPNPDGLPHGGKA